MVDLELASQGPAGASTHIPSPPSYTAVHSNTRAIERLIESLLKRRASMRAINIVMC